MKGSKQMGNAAKRGPRRGASAAKDGKATTEEGARATGVRDTSNIEDESSSGFIPPKCEPTAKSGENLIQQEGISAQSRATEPIEHSMEQVATTIPGGETGEDDIRVDRLASGHRMTTRAAKRQCVGLTANDD
ncbi:hypothetical protein WOLCODRAFT_153095 [Wolfiporia cocos MD-104 SS10]|uniref:Uncharacterized protein n=1 Tax=Wolfiporia cocos (strain MD-104) TaxID=742152 RepID=A0A2H3JSX8_WOLCO|nr:hypothetical protein WOLCODRAFT_153095 [Wolfiporia cocos MD-104 SS10]